MRSSRVDLVRLSTHGLEARSIGLAGEDRALLAADAFSTSIPRLLHRLYRSFEQIVHSCAGPRERPLRDDVRPRSPSRIEPPLARDSRGCSRFRSFRSMDRKLEQRPYLDHDPATERLTVPVLRRLLVESGSEWDRGRGLRSLPRSEARRRNTIRACALDAAAEDATGQRSGPAKYELRAAGASRVSRCQPCAVSLESAPRARSPLIPVAGER